jgi:fibro-slime domain-containing protein
MIRPLAPRPSLLLSLFRAAAASALLACAACGPGVSQEGSTSGDDHASGGDTGDLGLDVGQGSGSGSNGYCGTSLTGIVRDFTTSHPDFEYMIDVDPGIVLPNLGEDNKPVYAGPEGNPTTHDEEHFNQWFRDVPGVNTGIPLTLPLSEAGSGVYTYDNPEFFPIDDAGFGNEGNPHNYHFTFELHTKFHYRGGEVFTFTGDDDLFTFINGRLAIDLGGVHGAMSESIDLDARAEELGITPGNVYALDFFFAERHTSESNFRIDTTIASFVDCGSATDIK